MNPMADMLEQADASRMDEDDAALLHQALAAELAPPDGDAALAPLAGTLRERLLARVHRSALALRDFVTVRHGDTPWTDWHEGVRSRGLHRNGALRTRMIELQSGAALPPPGTAAAQEILVLRGTLSGPQELAAQSFCLRTRGQPGQWSSPPGALLYVRELDGALDALPAAEARWWPAPDSAALTVPASADGWLPFSPGVQIKPLRGSDEAISMLARLAAGASVGRHGHGLDEDCVMLQGDLYLGDVLLREGEYQLAPAGSEHDGLASDFGSVLYFHGAIDAALRGTAG